jgi:uncharacterized protein (TIGR02452 family)
MSILKTGTYLLDSTGRKVAITPALTDAISGTRLYEEVTAIAAPAETDRFRTAVEVTAEPTITATLRLSKNSQSKQCCLLNFASAKNPGGGFLGGSQAQEESLARSSGLYACLKGNKMYSINKQLKSNGLYSDCLIYSPGKQL